MKHFIVFLALVFSSLLGALYIKSNRANKVDERPVLKIFASSSFIKQWGPGPWLKEKFESTCGCRVEYFDAADSVFLMQKLKTESVSNGADLVLGFDQYDLEMAQKGIEWKEIQVDTNQFHDAVKSTLSKSNLIPYDWGVLAFLVKQSELKQLPKSFDDLLDPAFDGQISLQDPRTSSPGLQLLLWLIQVKGEENAFQYLQKLNKYVKSYGANWSMSYGLFQKGQVKTTLSWVTSTMFHLIEEKSTDVVAVEFKEGHPVQYEYMGIPTSCRNCELAEQFAKLILSKEGQRVIMEKNYMLPVLKGVQEGTSFEVIPNYKLIDMTAIPSVVERERILRRWSQIRRSE